MRKRIAMVTGLALLAGSAFAGTVTVLVKRTKVRSRPAHYARSLGTVRLGQQLESRGEDRGWHRVDFKGRKGYLHKSAVSAKEVRLGKSRSVGSTGTSAEEITLAGKGFNEQIEAEYRKSLGPEAYRAVDAMEKRQVSEKELRSFMRKGGLLEGGR